MWRVSRGDSSVSPPSRDLICRLVQLPSMVRLVWRDNLPAAVVPCTCSSRGIMKYTLFMSDRGFLPVYFFILNTIAFSYCINFTANLGLLCGNAVIVFYHFALFAYVRHLHCSHMTDQVSHDVDSCWFPAVFFIAYFHLF